MPREGRGAPLVLNTRLPPARYAERYDVRQRIHRVRTCSWHGLGTSATRQREWKDRCTMLHTLCFQLLRRCRIDKVDQMRQHLGALARRLHVLHALRELLLHGSHARTERLQGVIGRLLLSVF